MGFKKDDPNINRNGRPKGSRNKSTEEIKSILNGFISDNLEDLQEVYDSLEPKDKVSFLEKIIRYIIPQQKELKQNIDITSLGEGDLDYIIERINQNSEL